MSAGTDQLADDGGGRSEEEREALLSVTSIESTRISLETESDADVSTPWTALQELRKQWWLGGPLALNLFFLYLVSIVTMAFLGHIGQRELAAGALAMAMCNALGRLFYMGMCGATDTLASQAFGAGNFDALHVVFQRSVLFIGAHALPVTILCYVSPSALLRLGVGAEECALMRRYILTLIPSLWLEAVDRPLNRMLVAQQISLPQLCISGIVVLLHLVTNLAFSRMPGYTFLATGVADSLARCYYFVLQATYIHRAGLGHRVWGTPNKRALRGWPDFAKLAYPSAAMKCLESWCFSGMTVAAGLLPHGAAAVAAISIAFNVYGVLFMSFMGVAVAVGSRVGGFLGSQQPGRARLSAFTAISFVPAVWVVIAVVLVEPHSQAAIVRVFTDGSDALLVQRLKVLLRVVAVLELLDGAQTVMSGVISGAGKQAHGALINICAYYLAAVPAALLLAFCSPLEVYGLYVGLALGPAIQCLAYLYLITKLDWDMEATKAAARAAAH